MRKALVDDPVQSVLCGGEYGHHQGIFLRTIDLQPLQPNTLFSEVGSREEVPQVFPLTIQADDSATWNRGHS